MKECVYNTPMYDTDVPQSIVVKINDQQKIGTSGCKKAKDHHFEWLL